MTGDREGETYEPLVAHRLGRSGLHVKLDKGFEPGTYCVYVEFDELSNLKGFTTARRKAKEYCASLKGELGRLPGYSCGETEDSSRTGDSRRKRDLETTFLSFPIETSDGRFHDRIIKEQFRVAFLRTGQSWDQRRLGPKRFAAIPASRNSGSNSTKCFRAKPTQPLNLPSKSAF